MPDQTDALLALQAKLLLDVLRDNGATAERLIAAYAKVFNKLDAEWQAVLREIVEKRGAPGTIPSAELDLLILRSERIRMLRQQTAIQIARFASAAEIEVTREQRTAVQVGEIHARRLAATSLAESAPGLQYSFVQLPTGALQQLVGRFSNGEPLKALFDTFGREAAANAEQVLFKAVAMGTHPTIAARQLRTELGVPLNRALVISRTEMLNAYRSSSLETYRRNGDVVRAWRWNSRLEARTCASCVALHGTLHPLTERFREHPAGRCVPSPVTVSWEQIGIRDRGRFTRPDPQTGPEWFREQSAETQLRVLGPGKHSLYRAGELDLEDLVYEQHSARWGSAFREGSITQGLAQHGMAKDWQRYD